MAQGDVTWFEEAWVAIHSECNMNTDAFKIGLITTTPLANAVGPAWSGGTTNYSANEVTPGGNYVAGGAVCANASLTEVGGTVTFDTDDPAQWAQNASNPTNALFGILYDDTTAIKHAIAFIDLGGVFDMTTGPLTITVNASGWYTESG